MADGHGSAKHFRSDRGAKLAVDVLVKAFMELVRIGKTGDSTGGAARDWQEWAPQWVLTSWRLLVARDLWSDPPRLGTGIDDEVALSRWLDEELATGGYAAVASRTAQVERYLQHLEKMSGVDAENIVDVLPLSDAWPATDFGTWQMSAYGSTILGLLVGPDRIYWLQLGDGLIMSVSEHDADLLVDLSPDALANQTPSLGELSALYSIDCGSRPVGVERGFVVSSDGIPNSYNDLAGYASFCSEIVSRVNDSRLRDDLERWLPEISSRGSGDDVSVAVVSESPRVPRVRGGVGSARDRAGGRELPEIPPPAVTESAEASDNGVPSDDAGAGCSLQGSAENASFEALGQADRAEAETEVTH